jgi:hypothetical protein
MKVRLGFLFTITITFAIAIAMGSVVVSTPTCSIDANCNQRICWNATCRKIDVPVAKTLVAKEMERCEEELQLYYHLFYLRECRVVEYIPTFYGIGMKYECEQYQTIRENSDLLLKQYLNQTRRIRAEFLNVSACVL